MIWFSSFFFLFTFHPVPSFFQNFLLLVKCDSVGPYLQCPIYKKMLNTMALGSLFPIGFARIISHTMVTMVVPFYLVPRMNYFKESSSKSRRKAGIGRGGRAKCIISLE